ncbi:MAG: hypothetical protein K2G73_07075 [Eubacterium sp.]|nr:hypothetical protein [Eubacterium sp.]
MDNLNDIINSLSADDINMLKGVASSILGDSGDPEPSQPQQNTVKQSTPQQSGVPALAGLGFDGIDFDMIMKAKTIFERMNNTSNKNVDLIMALKPHLSPETQNKADQALRILKLFEVLPLLRELF